MSVNEVDVASLRNREYDSDRVQVPERLVIIGVCTHLGCNPIYNAGDSGGYFFRVMGLTTMLREGYGRALSEFQGDLLLVG